VLPWVTLSVFGVIGYVLAHTAGFYSAWGVVLLTSALAAYVTAFVVSPAAAPPPHERVFALALSALLAAQLFWLSRNPLIFYPRSELRLTVLTTSLELLFLAALAGFGVCATASVSPPFRVWVSQQRWLRWQLFWVFAVLCLILKAAVLAISPAPAIDVYTSGMRGVEYLLQGLDPYAQDYPDLYKGAAGYKPTFFYGPGYLLWIVPGWLLGDIRVSNLAAEILVFVALLRLRHAPDRTAGSAATGWIALIWLTFPAGLFMLEQAWVDSILLMAVAWMWLACRSERFGLAGAIAGFALAGKQTGLVAVLLTLLWVFRTHGRRHGVRALTFTTLTSLLFFAPFLLWHPSAIWWSLVVQLSQVAPRMDALTLGAWLARYGISAGAVLGVLSLLVVVAAAVWTMRRPLPLWRLIGLSVICYFSVYLFGFQAFCNYYWFVAGLVMFSLAEQLQHSHSRPSDDIPSHGCARVSAPCGE
jgi:hypothetical protein